MDTTRDEQRTTCCVVGGGPAGVMLGLLLARAGVEVLVLEKHADFFRDFRGDTIHPSTMQALNELGYLEEFLKLPLQRMPFLKIEIEGQVVDGPDFRKLKTVAPFIALAPQWHFLNFLVEKASQFPTFHIEMNSKVTGLIEQDGKVVGVKVNTSSGEKTVLADLVVGADGRNSTVRPAAGMTPKEHGVPIDVLWFRIGRPKEFGDQVLGHLNNGRMMITLDRGDYIQAGLIIAKGAFAQIQEQGLPAFRETLAKVVPLLRDEAQTITDWEQVKLLTVQINRLERWSQPGLLCIGDAAHAMSPAGGVGVNLAIQDAIATANLLAEPLREGRVTETDLRRVQQRRAWPTRVIQRFQVILHRRILRGVDGAGGSFGPPWPLGALIKTFAPTLRRLAGKYVGLGVRPEHVESGVYTLRSAESDVGKTSTTG